MLYHTLRLIHIVAMTAWFASTMFAAGDARRSIASGKDLDGLRDRLRRGATAGGASAFATILTGFALIYAVGGFGQVPRAIHTGLLLALLSWAVAGVGVGGATRGLDAAIAAGADPETLRGHAKRIAMMSGIFQLVWLLTLITMVFRTAL